MKLSKENLKWHIRAKLAWEQIVTYCYIWANGYRFVSWVHQRIWDRAWDNVVLPVYKSLDEVVAKARTFVWKEDGLDAVCTPQKVEAVGYNGQSPHGNDCDDAARANALAIRRAKKAGYIPEIVEALFLSNSWIYESGKGDGHAVAMLIHPYLKIAPDGMVRFTYQFSYMDYGAPSEKVDTVEELVDLIRKNYTGGFDYVGMIWWTADPVTMKPMKIALR